MKKELLNSTTLSTDIKVEEDSIAVEEVEDENRRQEEEPSVVNDAKEREQQKDDYPEPYR